MEKPKRISLAVNLLWASIVMGVISSLYELTGTTYLRDHNMPVAYLIILIIFIIFMVSMLTILTLRISSGKNWARITYSLFYLGGIIGPLFSPPTSIHVSVNDIGLLQDVLQTVVLYLLFTKPGSEWFSSPLRSSRSLNKPELPPSGFSLKCLTETDGKQSIQRWLGVILLLFAMGFVIAPGILFTIAPDIFKNHSSIGLVFQSISQIFFMPALPLLSGRVHLVYLKLKQNLFAELSLVVSFCLVIRGVLTLYWNPIDGNHLVFGGFALFILEIALLSVLNESSAKK